MAVVAWLHPLQEVREFKGEGVVVTYTTTASATVPGAWQLHATVTATDAGDVIVVLRNVKAGASTTVRVAGVASHGDLVDVSGNTEEHPVGLLR